MWTILERSPVTSPAKRDSAFLGSGFDDGCEAMVVRPVPRHFGITVSVRIQKRNEIDGVPGQVLALEGLRRALADKLALSIPRPQTLENHEVNVGDFDRVLDDADQVGMDALKA